MTSTLLEVLEKNSTIRQGFSWTRGSGRAGPGDGKIVIGRAGAGRVFFQCDQPGLAGPIVLKFDGLGQAGTGREALKMLWAGRGRNPPSRNLIGRRCGLYKGRSALPMRRPMCFHGAVRAMARKM